MNEQTPKHHCFAALLTTIHHAKPCYALTSLHSLALQIKILKPAMRALEVASSTVIMDLLARRRIHHEIRLLDKFFKDGFRGLDSVL
jgi:hypothetical protein